MNEAVATFSIDRTDDIYALRQGGRVAAAAVGCDEAGQVRFATALSELAREAVANGGGATVTLWVVGECSLAVELQNLPRSTGRSSEGLAGLDAARKLIADVAVNVDDNTGRVTVRFNHGPAVPNGKVSASNVRAALERTVAHGPLHELRLENRNLIATLDELSERQEQLVQLNAELTETNHGVLAMYGNLADELEETNRGVVALFAELDDKSLRLKEANDAKSRFLASVSHELRSPVNSILGLARLLLDPGGDPTSENQRTELQLILRSAGELLELVNELLDLAKAESGRLEPAVARVDLTELFTELRAVLRPLARSGVALHVKADVPTAIETDRNLLLHVLRNLVTNALKFTTAGHVCVAVRDAPPYEVEILVSDTGIGIAAEDQARVFEEFFQVRGPLQADHKGTGLGLSYVRRVTQILGGRVGLDSEPSRGSTFSVRLPRQWQVPVLASGSPAKSSVSDFSLPTVLIVDDDPGFRLTLRGMLQGIAGQVLEAGGGREGLAMMRDALPEVAFVDLRMPDLDGTELLAEMNADPGLRSIAAIVVSGADLDFGDRLALRRAVAVRAKSDVNRETIREVLAEALGSRNAAT